MLEIEENEGKNIEDLLRELYVDKQKTLKEIVKDGLILVGDAARQANPLSGGGIVSGMIAGKIAGQVAAEAVQIGDVTQKFLKKYGVYEYSLYAW